MLEYKFNNLNVKCGGEDFLVSGSAFYIIEEFEEDGKEATFESAKLYDALNRTGYIHSKEVIGHIEECVVETLNQDSTLCRRLSYK